MARLLHEKANRASAEFAVIVSDAWQDRGVGSALLERRIAREGSAGWLTFWLTTAQCSTSARGGIVLGLPNGGVVDITRRPPAA